MEFIFWEWVNTLARWLHIVAAVAWIGSSFYFMALDASLRKRPHLPQGVQGEAWQVHGGGFYNMVKYLVAPSQMPAELTWFKWEAYTTWLSGFFLLCVLYYRGADLLLIDQSVMAFTQWQAIGLSVGLLAAGWIVYDLMCRSPWAGTTAPWRRWASSSWWRPAGARPTFSARAAPCCRWAP
ncbi:urate hydroxylase PuuD [Nitrospirillum sp. BR 11163]|nr:urate hydroxylase PuuD [Nitrospirillum sp. BR 11163]MEA1672361.1 urate hydroxylase PuuD [Nitrospirillum sp. BR 11163]